MGNFKIGETVALHILQDINLKIYVFPIDFTWEYINENYKKILSTRDPKLKKLKGCGAVFSNVCIYLMMVIGTAKSN